MFPSSPASELPFPNPGGAFNVPSRAYSRPVSVAAGSTSTAHLSSSSVAPSITNSHLVPSPLSLLFASRAHSRSRRRRRQLRLARSPLQNQEQEQPVSPLSQIYNGQRMRASFARARQRTRQTGAHSRLTAAPPRSVSAGRTSRGRTDRRTGATPHARSALKASATGQREGGRWRNKPLRGLLPANFLKMIFLYLDPLTEAETTASFRRA